MQCKALMLLRKKWIHKLDSNFHKSKTLQKRWINKWSEDKSLQHIYRLFVINLQPQRLSKHTRNTPLCQHYLNVVPFANWFSPLGDPTRLFVKCAQTDRPAHRPGVSEASRHSNPRVLTGTPACVYKRTHTCTGVCSFAELLFNYGYCSKNTEAFH